MSSLKNLKNRINNIIGASKITSALKTINLVKYKKSQNLLSHVVNYNCENINLINYLEKNNECFSNKHKDKKNKILFIVLGSDKGFCGSFNNKIYNELLKQIKNIKKKYNIISIGQEITNNIKNSFSKYLINKNFYDNKIKDYYNCSKVIFNNLIIFIKEYINCFIIYTKYFSIFNCKVVVQDFYPINTNKIICKYKKNNNITNISIDNNSIFYLIKNIKKNFLYNFFYEFYINSIISEYCARILAMEEATKNSKYILKILNKKYNKIRQMNITTGLIEIISGYKTSKQIK